MSGSVTRTMLAPSQETTRPTRRLQVGAMRGSAFDACSLELVRGPPCPRILPEPGYGVTVRVPTIDWWIVQW